jgi:transcriptional regulatory protein AMDR
MQDSAENEETYETRNLADFIGQDLPKVGEISRSERLYFIGTEFSNLNYLVRHRALRMDQKDVLHFGTRRLARKVPSVPEEALKLPPKALADELVRAYFVHVNRGFPIVDEDEFMESYNGSDVPKLVSLPLLNAIFLVGAHVLSSTREDCRTSTYVFFRRAKLLFDYRFEQHRETYLQVALLLTWQCDNLEDITSNSWHLVGVGSRVAFGMGMHRDARPSTLNAIDKRQWVRLWWCLFQFDVVVSASFGRPQAM